MYLIQNLTTDPNQTQTLVLSDGSILQLTLVYIPLQYGWFIQNLTYSTGFTLNGRRLVVSPNMLRQYKNQIPFGLAVYPNNINREITQQQDLTSGAFSFYILTAAEVAEYEAIVAGNSNA